MKVTDEVRKEIDELIDRLSRDEVRDLRLTSRIRL